MIYVDYKVAKECMNLKAFCLCLKCGKCGRVFGENGIMIASGGTHTETDWKKILEEHYEMMGEKQDE